MIRLARSRAPDLPIATGSSRQVADPRGWALLAPLYDLRGDDLGDADALRRRPELAPDLGADRAPEALPGLLALAALGVHLPGERRDRDDQDADLVEVVPLRPGQRGLHLGFDVLPVLRRQPPRRGPRDLGRHVLSHRPHPFRRTPAPAAAVRCR